LNSRPSTSLGSLTDLVEIVSGLGILDHSLYWCNNQLTTWLAKSRLVIECWMVLERKKLSNLVVEHSSELMLQIKLALAIASPSQVLH